MTFFISLFILLMQFLWKYIDDLVGKGLGGFVIMKLMLYFAAIAWNFSYFKEGAERKEALDRFLLDNEQFSGEKKNQMYTIVNSLSMRKKQTFWQYDFMLVNYETVKGEKDSTVYASAIPYSLINIESVFGKIN